MAETAEAAANARPAVAGLAHVSMPVRDVAEALRFWTDVFGARVVLDLPGEGFAEVELGGMILGFSRQQGGWTSRGAEFPHYAFKVDPENMVPLKERLSAFGVPTHAIWTRNRTEALMYFRDPSGNLFEFYCMKGFEDVRALPVGGANGSYRVDLAALNYDTWNDPKQ